MKENQHIEWKETWRDEYLKWICGFANAEGGVLVIGRNSRGEVVGLSDADSNALSQPAEQLEFPRRYCATRQWNSGWSSLCREEPRTGQKTHRLNS